MITFRYKSFKSEVANDLRQWYTFRWNYMNGFQDHPLWSISRFLLFLEKLQQSERFRFSLFDVLLLANRNSYESSSIRFNSSIIHFGNAFSNLYLQDIDIGCSFSRILDTPLQGKSILLLSSSMIAPIEHHITLHMIISKFLTQVRRYPRPKNGVQ